MKERVSAASAVPRDLSLQTFQTFNPKLSLNQTLRYFGLALYASQERTKQASGSAHGCRFESCLSQSVLVVSSWPNGQGVGLRSRRLRVRVPSRIIIKDAWMSITGVVCRLQICRSLTAQWFDSTFCATYRSFDHKLNSPQKKALSGSMAPCRQHCNTEI